MEQVTSDDALISYYGTDSGLSPEEVLLEKERRTVLVGLVKDVMQILSRRDRKILWLYIKGCSQRQIGDKLGITQQSISLILKKMPKVIQKHLSDTPIASIKEYLLDNPSTKEADVPREILGWPCVSSQKIAIEGRWGILHGRKVYRSQTKCVMKSYLRSSFGIDTVACTFCNTKCTEG